MLSRILSYFSFSFSSLVPKGKEDAIVVMDVHTKRINGVISTLHHDEDILNWRKRIEDEDYINKDRLNDLRGCEVYRVEHYRGRGLIAHELILVYVRSGKDERVVRLERLNRKTDGATWTEETARKSKEIIGRNTGNLDRVKVRTTREAAFSNSNEYRVVQSVTFPHGALNIIDILSIAFTITTTAENYSMLSYMCWWWAAVFFRCAQAMAGSVDGITFTEGEVFSDQGRVGKVRLIGQNCELLFTSGTDHGGIIDAVRRAMKKDRVPQDSIDEFTNAIESDSKSMVENHDTRFQNNPVQQMLKLSLATRQDIIGTLEKGVAEAIAQRNAVENARGEVEHARGEVENARKRAADLEYQRQQLEGQLDIERQKSESERQARERDQKAHAEEMEAKRQYIAEMERKLAGLSIQQQS